jgi:hypothetical protein
MRLIDRLRRLRLRPIRPSERLLAMAMYLQELSRCEQHPVQRGLLLDARESLKQAWMIERDREQKAVGRMRRKIRQCLRLSL